MASDLERAYKTITAKRKAYEESWAYMDGEAELKFSTERLQRAFESWDVYFAQNWLSVVVTSVLDRLTLKGFSIQESTVNAKLLELWQGLQMELTAYDVHEAGLVTSEAFVIVGRDEEGEVDAYYNDPRLVHVFYRADKPRVKDFAAKLWYDDSDEKNRLALFYPDRTEVYAAPKRATQARAFNVEQVEPNETGAVPVFHFRNNRRGKGEFGKAEISMQDAINKLFSDMMVAAEFTSVKQRVIISKADPGELKTFENWWIPDENGKVQEIGGADLKNFLEAMDKIAQALGIITRTPKHYFFSQGSVVSGEALIAMESPLIKKVMQRQENFSVTWQELAAYLLKLSGNEVRPQDIQPVWGPVSTVQPRTSAEILQIETSAGVPLEVSAKRQGWSEDEIAELDGDSGIGDNPDSKNSNDRDGQESE